MSEEQEGAVPPVTISIDGEGTMGFFEHSRVREGKVTNIAALPRGMVGGRASVAIAGRLKDGSYAFLQTSMRIVLQAFAAFQARYGLEADGNSPASLNTRTRERINTAIMITLIREREGAEVTLNVDELNALMQNTKIDVEMQFSPDNKHITLRMTRSD